MFSFKGFASLYNKQKTFQLNFLILKKNIKVNDNFLKILKVRSLQIATREFWKIDESCATRKLGSRMHDILKRVKNSILLYPNVSKYGLVFWTQLLVQLTTYQTNMLSKTNIIDKLIDVKNRIPVLDTFFEALVFRFFSTNFFLNKKIETSLKKNKVNVFFYKKKKFSVTNI